MHDDEIDIDVDLVTALLAAQFPLLAGRRITEVRSTGTVNAIYRLGDDLCVRLPRTPGWAASLDREWRWLPQLAPQLSLQIPEPVGQGRPDDTYPYPWAVYRWLDGVPYADELVAGEAQAGRDLAQFVLELRRIDTEGGPAAGRRPLAELDVDTRRAIMAGRGVIDSEAALAAWERALRAPVWSGAQVWIHTDLLRPNVLVAGGRISAVIDFGGAGIGDPAADVIAAWSVFGRTGQEVFRECLQVDDGTWARARGYALHQAAAIIPYYPDTNPGFVTLAKRTVERVLTDLSDSGRL